MFRKIAIMLFVACSGFLVSICIFRKANNKPPISINIVLSELQNAKINYSIGLDINELSSSLKSLNSGLSQGSGDILKVVKNLADNIYYFGRFILKLIVHVLQAVINIIVLVIRLLGFENASYISIWDSVNVTTQVFPPGTFPGT